MLIRVKTIDAACYDVTVRSTATVPDLKASVYETTGVDVERQRLIFQGKVLKNDKDIAFYSIQDGMTIHMVERTVSPEREETGMPSSSALGNDESRNGAGSSSLPGRVRMTRMWRPSESRSPSDRRRNSDPRGASNVSLFNILGSDRVTRSSPEIQIRETPNGVVVGARIDLDGNGGVPPFQDFLERVMGLSTLGGGNSNRNNRTSGSLNPPSNTNGNQDQNNTRIRSFVSRIRRAREEIRSNSAASSAGSSSFPSSIERIIGQIVEGSMDSNHETPVNDTGNPQQQQQQQHRSSRILRSSNGRPNENSGGQNGPSRPEDFTERTNVLLERVRAAASSLGEISRRSPGHASVSSNPEAPGSQGGYDFETMGNSILHLSSAVHELTPVLDRIGTTFINHHQELNPLTVNNNNTTEARGDGSSTTLGASTQSSRGEPNGSPNTASSSFDGNARTIEQREQMLRTGRLIGHVLTNLGDLSNLLGREMRGLCRSRLRLASNGSASGTVSRPMNVNSRNDTEMGHDSARPSSPEITRQRRVSIRPGRAIVMRTNNIRDRRLFNLSSSFAENLRGSLTRQREDETNRESSRPSSSSAQTSNESVAAPSSSSSQQTQEGEGFSGMWSVLHSFIRGIRPTDGEDASPNSTRGSTGSFRRVRFNLDNSGLAQQRDSTTSSVSAVSSSSSSSSAARNETNSNASGKRKRKSHTSLHDPHSTPQVSSDNTSGPNKRTKRKNSGTPEGSDSNNSGQRSSKRTRKPRNTQK